MTPSPSPRSGDLVRARIDDREAASVEGVLHLRYVPSLDDVQVNVVSGGRVLSVQPESIEVIEAAAVDPAGLEGANPLSGDPRWRPTTDLATAQAAGLVATTRVREGGTWGDMRWVFDGLTAPLLAAGWAMSGAGHDESWEFGDTVYADFDRDGLHINLEYYEHGELTAYVFDPDADDGGLDDEPAGPVFDVVEPTPTNVLLELQKMGWVEVEEQLATPATGDEMSRRVNLRTQRDSDGARYLDASLNEQGDLLIEGCDTGPAVQEFFGRDEHEWVRTVRRQHLPALAEALGAAPGEDVLDVLVSKASGEDSHELERLLRDDVVPSELWVD